MEPSEDSAEAFCDWLMTNAIEDARGDRLSSLPVEPKGRFWLGRLAPEVKVLRNALGERGERLDPCEIGIRVLPSAVDARPITCRVKMRAWRHVSDSPEFGAERWRKTEAAIVQLVIGAPTNVGQVNVAGRTEIADALAGVGASGLIAEVHAEIEMGREGRRELVLSIVNVSPEDVPDLDTNLYEVELQAEVGDTHPFMMEGLPDSFRYDRRIDAYGVNSGVTRSAPGEFVTTDYGRYDLRRSAYWDHQLLGEPPILTFDRVSTDPLLALGELTDALTRWVDEMWASESLSERRDREGWDTATFAYAEQEAQAARNEVSRLLQGRQLLERNPELLRAFALANLSFARTGSIRHQEWRPFQLGFVLANIASLEPSFIRERDYVDTLWFATGGGKTETYLLLTLTAAFYDRLRGKRQGITSWTRFPLRMLSLQQTQRFADVFASAELIRRSQEIGGDVFAVGFFVGQGGTPNKITHDNMAADPDDPGMPARYQVLLRCPFCGSDQIVMRFDRDRWTLDHMCSAAACPWSGEPLPFRVVDDEIYRFLPTVVIGTLDKAASVAMQAAMRGFYGAPLGRCARPNHGFTYARRRASAGCLFPGCNERPVGLEQEVHLYAPSLRMQDELHLLRDTLGCVDSHYEAVLDGLQGEFSSPAKIIASSATLAGHERQSQALYRRQSRVFPIPGPVANKSFWSVTSERLNRRYVALSPRGVTLELANDQLVECIQRCVRRALDEPQAVAAEANVREAEIPALVLAYGVQVVYGSTLKDVEAAARSFETQIPLTSLNTATLTGRTPLEEVRAVLDRLVNPEATFNDRIHLIAASSMLSHGVDIDRLNVMVMLGLPLATAEFIQTTARVGRRLPGLVFALHKIGRERDAAIFRVFPSFAQHMDRLVDPVPITAKSRRVLELTFPGIEQARIYALHEPRALGAGMRPLTLADRLRSAFARLPVLEPAELQDIIDTLAFTGPLDEYLRRDVTDYVRAFYRALNDPAGNARFVSDLFYRKPMLSLRDVEEQVTVYSRGGDQ